MKMNLIITSVVVFLLGGCDSLRFAPGETQKQNAWLHHRAAQFAADLAVDEQTSQQLRELTSLCQQQSLAFVADYGLPVEFVPADSAEQILNEANFDIADSAVQESTARPDVWEVTDGALNLGISIAALLGGVYGVKVSNFLKQAKAKSEALKEIVKGNELFKQQNPDAVAQFKSAQKNQSPQTKQIVTEIKS